MPKPQYTQKFRAIWLKDPALRGWLEVVKSTTGETSKCKYCKQLLRNHYNDLKAHSLSKKHKVNEKLIVGDVGKILSRSEKKKTWLLQKSLKASLRYLLQFIAA